MIEIELPIELLDSPLGADVVGAWMLWPDGENRRNGAIRRYGAKRAFECQEELNRDELVTALEYALTAPAEEELRADALQRHAFGTLIGTAVRNLVGLIASGKTSTLGAQFSEIARILTPKRGETGEHTWPFKDNWFPTKGLPSSTKSLTNTYWPIFRPVCHFWAALVHQADDDPGQPMPCRRGELRQFLALSEQYRMAAESTHLAHAGSLLGPGEAFRLPAEVLVQLPALAPLKLVAIGA